MMNRTPIARLVIRGLIAAGILLSMLMAGAAPSDFAHGIAAATAPLAP